MGPDPSFDLLAFADRLGEPSDEASLTEACTWQGPTPDRPMTPEQTDHLNHLLRRSGRSSLDANMTFAEAKSRITELLHELG